MKKELSQDDIEEIKYWQNLCLEYLVSAQNCIARVRFDYNLQSEKLTEAIKAAIAAAKGE